MVAAHHAEAPVVLRRLRRRRGGEAVANAAESLNLERQVDQVRRWADQPQSEQQRWPLGPFVAEVWLRMTDAELAQFKDEIVEVMDRWADRKLPDDGQKRETVFTFARGVPGHP